MPADTPELLGGPPAVDQSGNLTVWLVKTVADINAVKLTELSAATSYRGTYSFTPDGYALTITTEKLPDDRLTSPTKREAIGVSTPAIADLKYVSSTATTSLAVVLADGGEWVIVDRRGIPQTAVAAVGNPYRAARVTLGPQNPGPTDGTGKFTLSNAVAVSEITLKPGTFAA